MEPRNKPGKYKLHDLKTYFENLFPVRYGITWPENGLGIYLKIIFARMVSWGSNENCHNWSWLHEDNPNLFAGIGHALSTTVHQLLSLLDPPVAPLHSWGFLAFCLLVVVLLLVHVVILLPCSCPSLTRCFVLLPLLLIAFLLNLFLDMFPLSVLNLTLKLGNLTSVSAEVGMAPVHGHASKLKTPTPTLKASTIISASPTPIENGESSLRLLSF